MSRTEEQYINLIQRKFVGKNQIRFTIEPLMYVGNLIAGVTAAISVSYTHLDEQKQTAYNDRHMNTSHAQT